ncbi:unnamed protein product, partial [Sphacelaria rigidula]
QPESTGDYRQRARSRALLDKTNTISRKVIPAHASGQEDLDCPRKAGREEGGGVHKRTHLLSTHARAVCQLHLWQKILVADCSKRRRGKQSCISFVIGEHLALQHYRIDHEERISSGERRVLGPG